ncbi:hypothetical protein ACFL2J_00265 [Candidatus Omnitrophota bacterium]
MFYNTFHKLGRTLRRSTCNQSGQALLELSVFGTLIILLIGVLVTYGLRYNYQQQASIEAFRVAQEAAQRLDGDGLPMGSSSVTIIRDRHIPDPSNPFGVGSLTPIMASASVTRDTRIDATADDYESLPKMTLRFGLAGSVREEEFATAGIREETVSVNRAEFENFQTKYRYIYGSVDFDPDKWPLVMLSTFPIKVRIIDSVEGEIVDYSSAIRQARLLVDRDFFIQQCRRRSSLEEQANCGAISAIAIPMPWYVQGCYHNGSPYSLPSSFAGLNQAGDTWDFLEIERLFIHPDISGTTRNVEGMGLQPKITQVTEKDFKLHKVEDSESITTTDNVAWSTVTSRAIMYNDKLNRNTGKKIRDRRLRTIDIDTERSDETESAWSTKHGD